MQQPSKCTKWLWIFFLPLQSRWDSKLPKILVMPILSLANIKMPSLIMSKFWRAHQITKLHTISLFAFTPQVTKWEWKTVSRAWSLIPFKKTIKKTMTNKTSLTMISLRKSLRQNANKKSDWLSAQLNLLLLWSKMMWSKATIGSYKSLKLLHIQKWNQKFKFLRLWLSLRKNKLKELVRDGEGR